MRAELLQKSVDAQSTLKKASAPTIPLRSRGMPRKMTDTTPLKGIPSRMPTTGFRSPITTGGANRPNLSRTPAGKKEGGVKLIDFSEQPIGLASAKRRKKQEAEEAHKKALAEAAEQAAAAASASSSASSLANASATQAADSDSDAAQTTNSSATPDYAAGLTASTIYTQPATPAPQPQGKLDNGQKGSKPVPPLVPVNSGNHDLSADDIEMVDEDEVIDAMGSPGDGNDGEPVEEDDEDEDEEMVDGAMEEDDEEEEVAQQQQQQHQQQVVVQQQPQQQTIVTNSMGTIKLQSTQGSTTTTPSGLIIKTIDPNSVNQQQRLPFNQIFTQGTAQNTLMSPSTSQHITMPPGITVVSTSTAGAQGGTPTKIVQIKTAPTTYMMSPQGSSNAPPPLIATQQGQQYVTLGQQQQGQLGKKTVLVSATGQQLGQATMMGGNTSNMVFVGGQQGQQSQQLQTAQIITNAAGQRFMMTPQKIGMQAGTPTTINTIGAQQAVANNKPIILSNQTLSSGTKGVIIRSIGPTGAAVYQQIPMSSVTRLQNIGSAGGTTFIQKKADMPALVPTSGAMTMMMQQQPQQQQVTVHQSQPTLITATRAPQQRAPGTTIIRPVLASGGQQIQGLQGYTIVQRGGPGQPMLIQAIPQQQQQQQVQQVQRIITAQQPTTVIQQQQQQQQQTVKRQVIVQQPARKGLTLAVSGGTRVGGFLEWVI